MKSNKEPIGDLEEMPSEEPPSAESVYCKTKTNMKATVDLEETPVEDPPPAESLYCKTKSNMKTAGDLEEMTIEDPPHAEPLYCKKDGKRPFMRDFPEEMPPEEPSVGDALAEAKRGRLKNADLAMMPGGDPPDRLPIPDEEPPDPPEVPVERDPHSYPGAHRVYGPERSSSNVSIESYGGLKERTEDAMPSQPPDALCSQPSENNDPNIDTDDKCVNRRVIYWLAGIALLIACVGAVVGIVVSLQKSDSPDPRTTDFPSASPTVSEGFMVELIQSRSPATSFVNSSSAQSRALDWMLSSDPYTLPLEDTRLVQRFALATFWYSTHGATWSIDHTNHSRVGW